MIQLDYTNALSNRVLAGIPVSLWDELATVEEELQLASRIEKERDEGKHGYLDLPNRTEIADKIVAFAEEEVRREYENLVVCGIGGSTLGTTALFEALCHPYHNVRHPADRDGRPRLFVVDNVDPDELNGLLDILDLKRTLVNVVSKSGETTETHAQMLVLADRLRDAIGPRFRDHLVFTTDPKRGTLLRLGKEMALPRFEIPPAVGGRFSVLSPVSLFPAAAVGIDIHRLLAGAKMAFSRISTHRGKDPAFAYALLTYLFGERLDEKKRISVFMPYASSLRGLANWYRQLLAESLGKRVHTDGEQRPVGSTPVSAVGATDQHSQLQLYVDGPNDKWVTFVEVENFHRRCRLLDFPYEAPGFEHLVGKDVAQLLNMERRATELALTEANRPNVTFRLPQIDERTIGEFLGILMLSITYGGFLHKVNPYDQPGVEAGKTATYIQLGKPGYAEKAEKLKKRMEVEHRRIVGGSKKAD